MQAIEQWRHIAAACATAPRYLVFVAGTGCEAVEKYATQPFDPFEGLADELSFVHFLQELGSTAGFRASLGHVVLGLSGTASTDTPPVWDDAADEHDEDSFDEHDADVWLEEGDVESSFWKFTPLFSPNGSLRKENQRDIPAEYILNPEWIPDDDDLKEPDRSEYGGWEPERYGGYCGTIRNGKSLVPVCMSGLTVCAEYNRAAVWITLTYI